MVARSPASNPSGSATSIYESTPKCEGFFSLRRSICHVQSAEVCSFDAFVGKSSISALEKTSTRRELWGSPFFKFWGNWCHYRKYTQVQDWTEINFIINQSRFPIWNNLSAEPTCQTVLGAEVKLKKTDHVFNFSSKHMLCIPRHPSQQLIHNVFILSGDISFRRFSSIVTAGITCLMPSTDMQALSLKLAPVFCHILHYL